jgi:hypothetical protein
VNKGLSTEAGVFDTTSAGSSLEITTIAGVFQVLGLLVAKSASVQLSFVQCEAVLISCMIVVI